MKDHGISTGPALRRLGRAVVEKSTLNHVVSYKNYKIDHVVAGGSATADGAAGILLDIGDGNLEQAPYLGSLLSPMAGQMVHVKIVNGSPLIIGRIWLPNFNEPTL